MRGVEAQRKMVEYGWADSISWVRGFNRRMAFSLTTSNFGSVKLFVGAHHSCHIFWREEWEKSGREGMVQVRKRENTYQDQESNKNCEFFFPKRNSYENRGCFQQEKLKTSEQTRFFKKRRGARERERVTNQNRKSMQTILFTSFNFEAETRKLERKKESWTCSIKQKKTRFSWERWPWVRKNDNKNR